MKPLSDMTILVAEDERPVRMLLRVVLEAAGARVLEAEHGGIALRLLDLHQPRDAGGITSDAANPILRCRSCMWRWPCPTFRAISESFDSPWWTRREPFEEAPDPGYPQIACG